MKKIKTREEKEKEKRRNQTIIGLVLVVIMLLSTIGYAFLNRHGTINSNSKILKYNGIEFKSVGTMWQFEIQGRQFLTKYNPKEIENISIPFIVSLNEYYNKPLYFVSENTIAIKELAVNLNPFLLRWQSDVCLEGGECANEEFIVKNCSEKNINIIVIKELEDLNESLIYKDDNCIFIKGDYDENIKASDALLFKILGIKN